METNNKPKGTKEQLEELSEELGSVIRTGYPIEYDAVNDVYYQVVDGEEGVEYEVIDRKYYPVVNNFIF